MPQSQPFDADAAYETEQTKAISEVMATLPGGEAFCGVAAAAALLGDTWTLLLVRDLAGGPRRFTELHSSTGISERVLTDRLRTMVANGLITRTMYQEIPPRVEYALTERGQDVLPVLDALRFYGEKWLRPATNNNI
jgi:DNA-binding HxlR family transcriptional regulator